MTWSHLKLHATKPFEGICNCVAIWSWEAIWGCGNIAIWSCEKRLWKYSHLRLGKCSHFRLWQYGHLKLCHCTVAISGCMCQYSHVMLCQHSHLKQCQNSYFKLCQYSHVRVCKYTNYELSSQSRLCANSHLRLWKNILLQSCDRSSQSGWCWIKPMGLSTRIPNMFFELMQPPWLSQKKAMHYDACTVEIVTLG